MVPGSARNWIAVNAVQQSNLHKKRNMTTLHLRKSIGRSPLRHGYLLIPLTLACFALLPTVRAVTPAPDGGYPNNNTAEGDNALLKLTVGRDNTAIGFNALSDTTDGFQNTAVGSGALQRNNGVENTAVGYNALQNNGSGMENTAIGFNALL